MGSLDPGLDTLGRPMVEYLTTLGSTGPGGLCVPVIVLTGESLEILFLNMPGGICVMVGGGSVEEALEEFQLMAGLPISQVWEGGGRWRDTGTYCSWLRRTIVPYMGCGEVLGGTTISGSGAGSRKAESTSWSLTSISMSTVPCGGAVLIGEDAGDV